jgi:hypothetical protein
MQQRQAAVAPHQLVGRRHRQVRPRRDPRLLHRLLDREARRQDHHRPIPEAEGQQVAEGDRAVGRHGVVERAVDGAQHPAVGQLRQPAVDRLVEAKDALLDQNHRRRGGDRLGHRGDAKNRVAPHRVGAADRLGAEASTWTSLPRATSATMPGISPRSM